MKRAERELGRGRMPFPFAANHGLRRRLLGNRSPDRSHALKHGASDSEVRRYGSGREIRRRSSGRHALAPRGRAFAAALVLFAATGAGCTHAPLTVRPPEEARRALEQIEQNSARIAAPLTASPALVSFRFRDADGRERRLVGQSATLIFGEPRCLYFDIKNLAGSLAHIGCDDERYWFWVDLPDIRKLWWGSWEALASDRARSLAVPPDRLLDALMFRALPERLADGPPPLLAEQSGAKRLLFQRYDDRDWPYVAREVVLASSPPHLPVEIVDRGPDGALVMQATLGNYQRVSGAGSDAPFTPRRYVVQWPRDHAEMRLDLLDVKYRTRTLPFCDFPAEWKGPVESLDREESGAPQASRSRLP